MSQRKPKSKAAKKKPSRPRPMPKAHYDRIHAAVTPPAPMLPAPPPALLKLDLGCGPNKKPGYLGVDRYSFPNVDFVTPLGDRLVKWPFADNSVEDVHCSHFLEHLTQDERAYFMNELFRVLTPGGKALFITPHWCSNRAYGDITHKWPAISEMFFFYLNAAWRQGNAPHTDLQWNPLGFNCDFDFGANYNTDPELIGKSDETQRFMMKYYKEAAQDIVCTITKRLPTPA